MRPWSWWLVLVLAAARARELDPAACAARFDVQRDKIIRTEESREMGARYLAELDVGSRAECLRLCCETDACDVFVFEEKSPGSCYLFKCGPPEDFRCKFTTHGNFSSGVLALSRRLAELQDQERLAHHERELTGLRNSVATSSTAPGSVQAVSAPQPLQPHPQQDQQQPSLPERAAPPPLRESRPQLPQPLASPRRCSRYQFECRRGGECIAVYNACDGVPQCADGSDEAPELGCPAPPSVPTPATLSPSPSPSPAAAPAPALALAPAMLSPVPHAQVVVQGAEGEVAGAASADGGAGELWPRRLAQPQRRYPGLMSGGGAGGAGNAPHIFSHQGGLLQPAALVPAWPHRAWPPDSRTELDNMEGVAREGGGVAAAGWGYPRLEPWPDERRAWPVPSRLELELPAYVPAKTMPELPLYSEQQQQMALRDAPKKGFEVQPVASAPASLAAAPTPLAAAPSTNITKKKTLKVTQGAAPGPVGGAVAAAHEARAPWGDERDGPSEHPPAAVLLLVLGSLLTAALGALLACRARAARRRRRAHPRLALDADYLVNGMYL